MPCRRASNYVLVYLVGPFIAEWWACVFGIVYGACLFIRGTGALSLGVFRSPLTEWFAAITPVFGGCVSLAGLLALQALHRRQRNVFLAVTLFNMLAWLWIAIFFLIAVPLSIHAVWAYMSHALLHALIFVRCLHRIPQFWHECEPGDGL